MYTIEAASNGFIINDDDDLTVVFTDLQDALRFLIDELADCDKYDEDNDNLYVIKAPGRKVLPPELEKWVCPDEDEEMGLS